MRPAVLLAAGIVRAGCGGVGAQGSTGGYVSGDRSITVTDAPDRRKAPVLSGDDLEGRRLSNAEFAGDTDVVNVWGSWLSIKPRRTWIRARRDGSRTVVEVAALDHVLRGDRPADLDDFLAQLQAQIRTKLPDEERS